MESNELSQTIISEIIDVVQSSIKKSIIEEVQKLHFQQASLSLEYLSAKEAAKFLRIKLSTLYSKVEKGDLPHFRSGERKLLFSSKELEAYVLSKRSKSKQQIIQEVDNYINSNK